MAKFTLTEGMLDRFVATMSSAIAKGRADRLQKAFDSDPELQRLTRELEAVQKKIRANLEKKLKDPKFKDAYEKHIASTDWTTFGRD